MARVRDFFAARGVLEVDTPLVVNAPVSDVHIHSAAVRLAGSGPSFFLHTSPEYAMNRLLAAGSGDIFQVCHVVRGFERGRLHNPEFTLLEFYQAYATYDVLMHMTERLFRHVDAFLGERLEKLGFAEDAKRWHAARPFTLAEPFARVPMQDSVVRSLEHQDDVSRLQP